MQERFIKIKDFPKYRFREKLLNFFGKEFIDKIESERGIKIDELKKTPFYLLELERLVFKFFFAETKDKEGRKSPLENPSYNKLTQQYFGINKFTKDSSKVQRLDSKATDNERDFLFASSVLFNLDPTLSSVQPIIETKLFDSAKLLEASIRESNKGIKSLMINNPGLSSYYLRNIIGSSRLSLSLLMNFKSTSNLFNMETSLQDRYKEKEWFSILMALYDEVSLASKNLLVPSFIQLGTEHSILINRFIVILSSLEIFNELIKKAWKHTTSKEFKEENNKLIKIIEDFERYPGSPKKLLFIRSTQLFCLKEFLLNEYDNQTFSISDITIDRNSFSMQMDNVQNNYLNNDLKVTQLKESSTGNLKAINPLKLEVDYDDEHLYEDAEEETLFLSNIILSNTNNEELYYYLVNDDSMIPEFKKGDTLLVKETNISDSKNYNHYGKVHLVQFNNNIIARLLTPSLASDDLFTLSSTWPDQEIKKEDLKILGIVVMIIKNLS